MKKLFSALILCTAILCGCSENDMEEISEASAPETSSVTTVTETETTTAVTTSAETAEGEIILTPIPSKEPFEVMACQITDDIMNDKEEDFPDKEALKFAREICFADELIRNSIDENNIRAEDLLFISGGTFDFDSDGKDESLICLGYTQPEMGGNALIYIDGEKYTVLESYTGRETSAKVIRAGEYIFLLSYTGSEASYYCDDIYSFERGMPEKAINFYGAHSIHYKNGAFYCESDFWGTFPFVLCGDGNFRQLGFEWISREDFEAHVKNGGAYLDKLAEDGDEVTVIYTYGHYIYMLYGKGFCYDVQYDDGFVIERQDSDGIGEGIRFTGDVIHGGDVWAVQTTRSQDYNIGGGYVCYTTGKTGNRILNVAKDYNITYSINLSDENLSFDPDWQINFYDMDTPPCFALKVNNSIDYRTYFIIKGKITEMNWTLDGERLDTVDYTMLKCRGEEDEFVSYSIPYLDDCFERRHFTFADGDYTNIVGYSEEIDGEIIKFWDNNSGKSGETANEIIHKVCSFWSNAYQAKTSYDGNERWLLLIEEEGFQTKEEMLNTLSEFCTPAAAEEVYSLLVVDSYNDFEIIDGRIYLSDGPPANYLPYYYIESAEEKDGVITAKLFAYYSGQDRPYRICPPLYAEFVREDGVWKISSLPKEK